MSSVGLSEVKRLLQCKRLVLTGQEDSLQLRTFAVNY